MYFTVTDYDSNVAELDTFPPLAGWYLIIYGKYKKRLAK